MMTVFLDRFKIFCVDVLVGVFKQGTLQGVLCVPGLRPRLQVLLYGRGDSFVMRRHNLGTVLPVHLRPERAKDDRYNSRYAEEGRPKESHTFISSVQILIRVSQKQLLPKKGYWQMVTK